MGSIQKFEGRKMAFESSRDAVVARIEKQRGRRQSNKVLHAHPSPIFWGDRRPVMEDVFAARKRADARFAKRINAYVATPYCLKTLPERCGFCLFPSEDFRGHEQLRVYLGYLEREADRMRPHYEGDKVSTLYFGGGTSNLYRPDEYARLVGIARSIYDVSPEVEITLEGIPQLFTREKLSAMKDAGVNRISVGAQQLDDEMIKLSGRKQTARQVFDTIAWCQELDLEVSVDMIFGWPGQTVEMMLRDLEALIASGLRHITHYELNVAGRSDFAKNHRDALPSIDENLILYHESRRFLERHGFRQGTPYDWEKRTADLASSEAMGPGKYLYEENMRHPFFVGSDGRVGRNEMHGLGFAGVTIALDDPDEPGWSMVNATRVEDYFAALDRGEFPVDRAYHHERDDLRIAYLFQALQSRRVSRHAYNTIFGVDVLEEFDAEWAAFEQVGWATRHEGGIDIIDDGVFFTPLIQALLANDRVEAIRAKSTASTASTGVVGTKLVQLRAPARTGRVA